MQNFSKVVRKQSRLFVLRLLFVLNILIINI